MIEIGNDIITAITIGSTTPERIDWGNDQVWPETIATYLVITPTQATGLTEQSHSQVVQVSANTPWDVYESLDWVSVSKAASSATLSILANNSSGRSGNVVFSGGGLSETFYISQVGGYYMRMLTTAHTIASTGETIDISFISTYQDNPYTSITSSVTYNTGSGWAQFVSKTVNGNVITYRFNLMANTDTVMNRIYTFRFDQDAIQSTQYLTISFTQNKRYVPANISGFTRYTYGSTDFDKDWQVGTYVQSYQNIGGQSTPIKVLAIFNASALTADCTANFTIDYTTRATSATTASTVTGPRTITTSMSTNIPSGDTAYGITLTAGPNLQITNVSDFSVVQGT